MGTTILMNEISKPYYRRFVNPRFLGIYALGWKVNIYFEDVDHLDLHLVQLWEEVVFNSGVMTSWF